MMNLKSIVNKGLLDIYLPMIIIFILLVSCLYLIFVFGLKIENYNVFMGIGVFVSIAICWLWWSYKVVKWKIWALSKLNFEESEELYYKAIDSGLIWPKGSIFNRTEIWYNEDKNKWLKIESEIRDIFY